MPDQTLETISQHFMRFARVEAHNVCPLYEILSLEISRDEQILELAGFTRTGQPIPNMLFAAIRFLELRSNEWTLPFFVLDNRPEAKHISEIYPQFRKYCMEHREEIRSILETRRVQTNEIGRCSCLVPGFAAIHKLTNGRPWNLVDLGASAGLNLNFDRYLYRYGAETWGKTDSRVRMECQVRGERAMPIQGISFNIDRRMGVDINPLDVNSEEDMLWLKALVWPNQGDRERRLAYAQEIARENPPNMVSGDASEMSRKILEGSEKDSVFVFFSTFAFNQLNETERNNLYDLLKEHGNSRDLFLLTMGFSDEDIVELRCSDFRNGGQTERILASCDPYGKWIKWLDK